MRKRRTQVIVVLPVLLVEAGWLSLLSYAGLRLLAG